MPSMPPSLSEASFETSHTVNLIYVPIHKLVVGIRKSAAPNGMLLLRSVPFLDSLKVARRMRFFVAVSFFTIGKW